MRFYKIFLAIVSAGCTIFLLLMVSNNNNNTIPLLYYLQRNFSSIWNTGKCLPIISRNSFLHPCVQQFLFHVTRYDLNLFVMEPSLLQLTLTDKERQLLTERGIASFPKNNNSFLFGMTEKQDQIKGRLLKKLVDIGFHYTQIIWPERNTPSHHIFMKNEIVVHVVVLFQRNTFFYSPGIGISPPDVERYLNLSTIGKFPTSFDRFQLESKNLSGDNLQVPASTMTYLLHFRWARFLECNLEVSAEFHRQHGSQRNAKLETSFKSIVPILKSIMDPLAAPFWIASGTLLGWYRECGVIRHTHDHDFAARSDFSPAEIYTKVSAHPEIRIYLRFGFPNRAFEITMVHKSVRSDLFFMKEESNYTWYAGHDLRRGVYFQYVYSKFTLCSAELLGLRVLVPCTPEKVIEEEYGAKWTEPVVQWNYITSSKNIGKTFHWSPSELRIINEQLPLDQLGLVPNKTKN